MTGNEGAATPAHRGRALGCLALAAVGTLAATAQQTVGHAMPAPQPVATAATAYAELPVGFEPNMGQSDPQVRFLAHGAGQTLFLTGDAAVLALGDAAGSVPARDSLRIQVVGANPAAGISGLDRLPGTANYMIGSDRTGWHTGIPTFGRVEQRDVLPGVGMAWYGNAGQLEYDLTLAPGVDASTVRLAYTGAQSLSVDAAGALLVHLSSGTMMQRAPQLYQMINGIRTAVAGGYVLLGNDQVGFAAGPHSAGLSLVVDPTLAYSTYLGGSGADEGDGIAVDSAGNAYVTGFTGSAVFPTTTGAFQPGNHGGNDAFVSKINAAGTALVYSTYLGGSGDDMGRAIALDSAGGAFVSGSTTSTDFPTTSGAFQTANAGGTDAFVTRLNASGTALVYSTLLGGTGEDFGRGIAVDASGSAHVVGETASSNFPTTAGGFQTGNAGGTDAFVTRLDPAGAGLTYSTYLGGSGNDSARAIAIDPSGNAYVTGDTRSPAFPTTAGAFQTNNGGGLDGFVTKVNSAGSALSYSTYIGGGADDTGFGIALDASGSAYVTGQTRSTTFPTTAGAFQTAYGGGGSDAFITKVTPAGSALAYSTYLGGGNGEAGRAIAVRADGTAYATGFTGSNNFPITADAFQTSNGGGTDAYATKLNAAGTALLSSTYLGGSSGEVGRGIALDRFGSAYLTGDTQSTDFPTTPGDLQPALGGVDDAFVAKIVPPCDPLDHDNTADARDPGGPEDILCTVTINTHVEPRTTDHPGTSFRDELTVEDATGGDDAPNADGPTGRVTFFLCGPTQVTPGGCPVGVGTQVGKPQTVKDDQSIKSPTAKPLAPGRYCFRVHYSGDASFLALDSTNGTTECFTVTVGRS